MRRILLACGLVLAVGLVANAQDTTTLLSQFLVDLRNGTWGVNSVVTGLTVTKDAIAVTSTTAETIRNSTAATGAVTVQMSPRTVWRGNAWDTAASQTVDFFAETLPATAATPTGTWKLGFSRNGGAATYPLTVSSGGAMTALGSITATNSITTGSGAGGNGFGWPGSTFLSAPNNGWFIPQITTGAIGSVLKTDALPTVSACGGGTPAVDSQSTPLFGAVTVGTGGPTTCTITFNGTAYPHVAICTATMATTTVADIRTMGALGSTTTLTIVPTAAWTDSTTVNWHCGSGK